MPGQTLNHPKSKEPLRKNDSKGKVAVVFVNVVFVVAVVAVVTIVVVIVAAASSFIKTLSRSVSAIKTFLGHSSSN